MIVERVTCAEIRADPCLGCLFSEPNGGGLWVGKHHTNEHPVIHRLGLGWIQYVVRGDFALLHRKVHDLMRPGTVASGENVRRAGSHVGVADDAAVLGLDAGVLESE